MKLPTFLGSQFTWKAGQGVALLDTLQVRGIPDAGFYVKSERTGATILFKYDETRNRENEFFDGEYMAFVSPGSGWSIMLQLEGR